MLGRSETTQTLHQFTLLFFNYRMIDVLLFFLIEFLFNYFYILFCSNACLLLFLLCVDSIPMLLLFTTNNVMPSAI